MLQIAIGKALQPTVSVIISSISTSAHSAKTNALRAKCCLFYLRLSGEHTEPRVTLVLQTDTVFWLWCTFQAARQQFSISGTAGLD